MRVDEPSENQGMIVLQQQMALFDTWVCEVTDQDALVWDADVAPAWCARHLQPSPGTTADLIQLLPYLEYFLTDAAAFWNGAEGATCQSGAFVATDGHDRANEWLLQATATRLGRRRLLYIGPYRAGTEEHREVMQKSRELMLAHEALQQKEAELSLSEARLRGILKVLPDQVFVLRMDGEVLAHAGGPDQADLTGLVIDTVVPELEFIGDTLKLCLAEGSIHTLTFERWIGSAAHYYEARFAPMSVDQVLMVVRDCTRAKTIERVKEEFLAIACNELRAPISGIVGVLEMAREEGLSEESAHWVGLGLESANRGLNLIHRLLDLKRIESGAQKFSRHRIAADKLVMEGLAQCCAVAEKAGRVIKRGVFESGLMVLADPDAVRQVLVMLVTNALKFTPEDEPIVVETRRWEGFARVSICDRGPGVRKKDQARLFEKFAQLEDGRSREEGAGLGLSIARAIVERHQGRIGVEADPDKAPGSTFWFAFPLL
ncbi:sensor histidine kinase [Acanthopleuribacter pedis]|uniref:histidine kinase n=1 Tax=Acanthopleuribacter pedis TaxID=442870 RepID=A0A8J7U5I0_9BACT|nr:HAMP domain-containing sensor histidine kinase [Acanthopleuribacter pedis]MBO1319341.1 hypothetical protein [Acanthopleuribacter pedis]